jgi:hypothetical protein
MIGGGVTSLLLLYEQLKNQIMRCPQEARSGSDGICVTVIVKAR